MTLDEAKRNLAAKREQLIAYRDGIDADNEVKQHARSMANGRITQIEMDIALVNKIEASTGDRQNG